MKHVFEKEMTSCTTWALPVSGVYVHMFSFISGFYKCYSFIHTYFGKFLSNIHLKAKIRQEIVNDKNVYLNLGGGGSRL